MELATTLRDDSRGNESYTTTGNLPSTYTSRFKKKKYIKIKKLSWKRERMHLASNLTDKRKRKRRKRTTIKSMSRPL
tara:strand:+ start:200 stop:430 length:231 start_codon:yes stop_codon:yes gene_type:complete